MSVDAEEHVVVRDRGGTSLVKIFDSMDERHRGRAGAVSFKPHRQTGSYFCLESTAFRIIAIDVEYHSFFGLNPKYKEPRLRDWLRHHVTEAKAAGQSVLLMSSDEPYSICSPDSGDFLVGLVYACWNGAPASL